MKYGIIWPDGSYTGPLAEHARELAFYAKQHGGRVYLVGSAEDPEVKNG